MTKNVSLKIDHKWVHLPHCVFWFQPLVAAPKNQHFFRPFFPSQLSSFFPEVAQIEKSGQEDEYIPWALGYIHSTADFVLR